MELAPRVQYSTDWVTDMNEKRGGWTVRGARVSEFAGADIGAFTSRFRSDHPTLVIYSLESLPWTGVIRTAPVDQALCALSDDYPGVYKAEDEWLRRMVDDAKIYKLFCREIKGAGVARADVAHEIFGRYVNWGVYGGGGRGFGKSAPYMGSHRVAAHLVPNELSGAVIDYHVRQLEQFGEHALVSAPEGSEYWQGDEIGGRSLQLFQHVLSARCPDAVEYRRRVEEICVELEEALDKLERGIAFTWDVHYPNIIRPPVNFFVHYINWGTEFRELEEKAFLLRAQLVRRLAWPQLYRPMYRQVEVLREQYNLADSPSVSPFVVRLYDELLRCLDAIESKYPVVVENPLERLSSF
jgi:hypothetical protein